MFRIGITFYISLGLASCVLESAAMPISQAADLTKKRIIAAAMPEWVTRKKKDDKKAAEKAANESRRKNSLGSRLRLAISNLKPL